MGKIGNSLLMLKLLQGGKKYSIKELAEILEVTPRQVRKYKNDFEKAVLAAANSFREDSTEEKERIKDFSWKEQLIEAEGGNTDGIAGLTGAFSGARNGINSIPEKFKSVENYKNLINLGYKLAE